MNKTEPPRLRPVVVLVVIAVSAALATAPGVGATVTSGTLASPSSVAGGWIATQHFDGPSANPYRLGATKRPDQARLSNHTVIRVPEDYETIQAAVDQAGPGTVIEIGQGRYAEDVVVSRDDLTLHSSVYETSGVQVQIRSIQVLGAKDVTVHGLFFHRVTIESSDAVTFDGFGIHPLLDAAGPPKLRISSSGSVTIANAGIDEADITVVDNLDGTVTVRGFRSTDSTIQAMNNQQLVIEDGSMENDVSGTSVGIDVRDSIAQISDMLFQGDSPPESWIAVARSEFVVVEDNDFDACGSYGIRMVDNAVSEVYRNTLHGGSCVTFVRVGESGDTRSAGCQSANLQNNRVQRGTEPLIGIEVADCDGVTLGSNQIANPTRAGVWVHRIDTVDLQYNRVTSSGEARLTGFLLDHVGGTVRSNLARTSGRSDSGINVEGTAARGTLYLTENRVIGAWARGIKVTRGPVHVDCNLVRGNTVGIEVEKGAGSGIRISDNSVNRLDGGADYGSETRWVEGGVGNWWGGQATAPHPVPPNGEDPAPYDRDPWVSGCFPESIIEDVFSDDRKTGLLPGDKDRAIDHVVEPRYVDEFGGTPADPLDETGALATDLYGTASVLSRGSVVLDASLSVRGHVPDRPTESRVYQFYLDVGPGGGTLAGRANFTPDLLVQDTRAAPGRALELFEWDASVGAFSRVRGLDDDVVTGLDLDDDPTTVEGLHLRLDLEAFGVAPDPDTGALDPPVRIVYRTVYWQDGRVPYIDEAPDNGTVVHRLVPREPEPLAEVYAVEAPRRAPVGEPATVAFHARWVRDRSPLDGTVTVNGAAHATDAGGTVTHDLAADGLGPATAAVTDVASRNGSAFIAPAGEATVTFDRIEPSVAWERRPGGRGALTVTLRYASDGAPVANATVELDGRSLGAAGAGRYHLLEVADVEAGPATLSVTAAGSTWPAAEVEVPARPAGLTPTPRVVTQTRVVERTVTVRQTAAPGQPGFGLVGALVALLVAGPVAARARRR